MSATLPAGFQIKGGELTITRVFNAPRPLVFAAYTEPEYLLRWWGPSEYPLVICNVDLRPGGRWHYCMKSRTTGDEAWGIGIYSEVDPPKKLVYADSFSDAEGHINEALPTAEVVVQFEDAGSQTRVVITTKYAREEELQAVVQMGMVEGITETLGQLEKLLNELQTA
ncbi:MAG: SRPBCC domain-containing protein [Anaerolineae bacterium]